MPQTQHKTQHRPEGWAVYEQARVAPCYALTPTDTEICDAADFYAEMERGWYAMECDALDHTSYLT